MPLLTATSTFGLGRRCWSSPQQCYPHDLNTLAYNIINEHPFNCPLSGTTRVSRYQKGKTNLDFTILLDQETVSGSGISWAYASLHLAPDR